jgi:hypothetical protein
MNKEHVMAALLEEMETEIERQRAANKQASSGATDSESKAESKWDTQGLESSYLARGYAHQFAVLVEQAEALRGFEPADFSGKPAGVGALVKCDIDDITSYIFLLHCCGGTDLTVDGEEVTVVTTESPLGAALSGKAEGGAFALPNGANGTVIGIE